MPSLRIDVLIELLERHSMQLYQLYTISINQEVSDELLRLVHNMDAVVEKLEIVNKKKFVLQSPPDNV